MSTSIIIALSVQLLFCIALPVFLIIKRKNHGVKPVFFGALTYFIFALAAQGVLAVVFTVLLPTADLINSNPLLYALFCGASSGIVEELGRFFCFKTFCKNANVENAVNVGIGYGGLQSFLVIGGTTAFYIVLAVMMMKGTLNSNLYQNLYDVVYTIESTTFFGCFLNILERIFVTALHIFLSVTVYGALTLKGKLWLLPVSMGLHFVYEFTAALYSSGYIGQLWLVEMIVAVITFAASGLAIPLYKKLKEI